MSNGPSATIYSIDTSSLMDWHERYYPTDIFPSLVVKFGDLIVDGRLVAADLVRDEVVAVGPAGLQAWAKTNKSIFDPTANHLAAALAILGMFPGMKDPRAQYDEADSYVIAVAQVRGTTVVTQETEAAQKRSPKRTHFIPDVCRDLGIPCINLLGLMRREGWQL